MNSDLDTLLSIKDRLENKEIQELVNASKVSNPTKEIEDSLTNFITVRLDRLERDAQFGDLLRSHLRQRFPEMDNDQLIKLFDIVSKNNNRSIEGILPLFQGDASGKIVTEHIKDTNAENTAQNLYEHADKDMLQAINYLTSVLSKVAVSNIIPGEVLKN